MSNGNVTPIRQDQMPSQQDWTGGDGWQGGWGWGPAPSPNWGHPPPWFGGHHHGCCCPRCMPQACVPCPPRPICGPIIGVTDGSDAAPGMVGEFRQFEVDVPFAAYPVVTQTNVAVGVIQPGDWDLTATLGPQGGSLRAVDFFLDPLPLGMLNEMRGVLWVSIPGGGNCTIHDSVVDGQTSRGTFAVPTLLAFSVGLSNDADPASGASFVKLVVTARRAR